MPKKVLILALVPLLLFLASCNNANPQNSPSPSPAATVEQSGVTPSPSPKPDLSQAIPEKLRNGDQEPILKVYDTKDKTVKEMDVESYLYGVVAGEMHNDWPEEALKAQAIIARTFVLRFVGDKTSKYKGADISTDIEEAQAYDEESVNERVKKAVDETGGIAILYQGKPIQAWFHADAGGQTALAAEGLNYTKQETPYIVSVPSPDSEDAPADTQEWSASFTEKEFLTAAQKQGLKASSIEEVAVTEWGPSGRAVQLSVNGTPLNMPDLRIALGSEKLRSTFLTSVAVKGGKVTFQGKGFGHGVGMSQWGAYEMAKKGATAEEIISYYFKDVNVEQLWQHTEKAE